jgi:hypothetical protein
MVYYESKTSRSIRLVKQSLKIMLFIVYYETIKYYIYYESTKRKLKTKYICECRCYERLQTKTKEFTRLSYTELVIK